MSKAQFIDFVNSNPMLKGFAGNHDAEKIFDILNEDEQICGAVSASEKGLPALLPSVKKIEDFISKDSDGSFPMTDFNKRVIGRMQRFVLEPFGYFPKRMEKSPKRMEKRVNGEIFKTAACYEYIDGKATMPIPNIKTHLKTSCSEKELRKAYIEDGDIGAMFKLFQLYGETGEQDKSTELIDIYMDRGYYRWLTDAEEAMMAEKNSQDNN